MALTSKIKQLKERLEELAPLKPFKIVHAKTAREIEEAEKNFSQEKDKYGGLIITVLKSARKPTKKGE